MGLTGLEPAHPEGHMIGNHTCLPIPPQELKFTIKVLCLK